MSTAFLIDEIFLGHVTPDGHPERVARLQALLALRDRARELGVTLVPARRMVTDEELLRVHTQEHVKNIAATAGRPPSMLDPDTFTSPESHTTARYAAGGVLDLVDRVMSGEYRNGFAAVRPPGHHAESHRAMGFCLFSNIAVAAAHAIERHGLERVLVVDWDVHHGNGTQEIFWEDSRVVFISLHQFPFYPGTGGVYETGAGAGLGCTVNIPLPGGCGDDEWLSMFDRVVVPVADQFRPQLVLLSAGFDAHRNDPLGGMRVTGPGFAAMANRVLDIAETHTGGRLVAVLEGGYDLAALSACVETVLRRMARQDRAGRDTPQPLSPGLSRLMVDLRAAHAARWKL